MNIIYFLFFISLFENLLSYKLNMNSRLTLYMKKEKKLKKFDFIYKSEEQLKYNRYLNDDKNQITIVVGPVGTGKTHLACSKAITMLKNRKLEKIILTRPLNDNLWTRQMLDIFLKFYTKSEIDHLILNDIIEMSPLDYMKDRILNNAFIIANNMQNSSPDQMRMLTTRIGVNSRIVITGDLNQTDKLKYNGLIDLVNKLTIYNKYNNTTDIKLVEMSKNDMIRSDIVEKIINIYEFKPPQEIVNPINIVFNPTNVVFNQTNVVFNPTQEIVNQTNIVNKKKVSNQTNDLNSTYKNYNINDDSALIPKSHVSKRNIFRKIWEDN